MPQNIKLIFSNDQVYSTCLTQKWKLHLCLTGCEKIPYLWAGKLRGNESLGDGTPLMGKDSFSHSETTAGHMCIELLFGMTCPNACNKTERSQNWEIKIWADSNYRTTSPSSKVMNSEGTARLWALPSPGIFPPWFLSSTCPHTTPLRPHAPPQNTRCHYRCKVYL